MGESEAWRVHGSETLVSDLPYIHLRRDMVQRRADSNTHAYYVIEQSAWVQALAITADDKMVLVRQYRYGIDRSSLEVPGGYAEPDEDPRDAALRELLEETGYGGGDWAPLITLAPNPAMLTNWLHCFVGVGVERIAEPTLDENEDVTVELHPADSIDALIAGEQVVHALHAVSLFAYARSR